MRYWLQVSTWRGMSYGATHYYGIIVADDGEEIEIASAYNDTGCNTRQEVIDKAIVWFDNHAEPDDTLMGYSLVDRLSDGGTVIAKGREAPMAMCQIAQGSTKCRFCGLEIFQRDTDPVGVWDLVYGEFGDTTTCYGADFEGHTFGHRP